MTIYLVRHGQKQPLIGDPGLTELGMTQAAQTAQFFATLPIDHIVASPMARTQQTAAIIGQALHLSVETNSFLIERSNWGDDPLQTFAEYMKVWRQASDNREYQPPIGDSSQGAGNRLEAAMESLESHPFKHIVMVSHGGIITDWLRNVLSDEYLIEHFFKNYQNLRDTQVPECSITEIKLENHNFQVVRLYETNHLQ